MDHDYSTPAGAATALREILDALTAYSMGTQRFGLSDLALLEEFDTLVLAGGEGGGYTITVSADEAMRLVLSKDGAGVPIGDKHAYVWDQFSDDTNRLAESLGILASPDDGDDE